MAAAFTPKPECSWSPTIERIETLENTCVIPCELQAPATLPIQPDAWAVFIPPITPRININNFRNSRVAGCIPEMTNGAPTVAAEGTPYADGTFYVANGTLFANMRKARFDSCGNFINDVSSAAKDTGLTVGPC